MDHPRQILYTAFTLLALACLSLTPVQNACAQEEPGTLYVGIMGGLNQSSFNKVTASSRQGTVAGVTFAYSFNEVFTAELGVSHSRKGAEGVTSTGGISRGDALNFKNADIQLDYFHFPVLFKLTAPLEFPVKLRAFGGPAFDFIRTAKINGLKSRPDIQADKSAASRFNPVDVEGVVGGELALPLPSVVEEIAIDGRYHFGLIDVDAEQQYFMKKRTFTGTVSLRFAL